VRARCPTVRPSSGFAPRCPNLWRASGAVSLSPDMDQVAYSVSWCHSEAATIMDGTCVYARPPAAPTLPLPPPPRPRMTSDPPRPAPVGHPGKPDDSALHDPAESPGPGRPLALVVAFPGAGPQKQKKASSSARQSCRLFRAPPLGRRTPWRSVALPGTALTDHDGRQSTPSVARRVHAKRRVTRRQETVVKSAQVWHNDPDPPLADYDLFAARSDLGGNPGI